MEKILALVDHPSEGETGEISEEGLIYSGIITLEILMLEAMEKYGLGQMLFFIGDDASVGLEMYGWAHGELSEEWIVIH